MISVPLSKGWIMIKTVWDFAQPEIPPFLASLGGLQDLSSPTRDQTHTPCIGNRVLAAKPPGRSPEIPYWFTSISSCPWSCRCLQDESWGVEPSVFLFFSSLKPVFWCEHLLTKPATSVFTLCRAQGTLPMPRALSSGVVRERYTLGPGHKLSERDWVSYLLPLILSFFISKM